jgi:HlyD family secretion protein
MVTIIIHNYNRPRKPDEVSDGEESSNPCATNAQKCEDTQHVIDAESPDSSHSISDAPTQKSFTAQPIQQTDSAKDSSQADTATKTDQVDSKAAEETPAKPDNSTALPTTSKWHRYQKPVIALLILLCVAVASYFAWKYFHPKGIGSGFASGNGRIEAVELDIATKAPGRIHEIYADEGDLVSAGQVVARMDTEVLSAQLRQAQAQEAQARTAIGTALAMVSQHESEQATARAIVTQRETGHAIALKTLQRSEILSREHAASTQEYDDDAARERETAAAVVAAKAQLAGSQATINAARAQVLGAQSNVAAIQASESQIQAEIDDTVLKAVRDGRIQFRIAQPGEVVAAGGKVLSMVDLSDVTMTFFLPESAAGRIAVGAEARIVLDAAPKEVILATITFVASVAQFTPKTVETKKEREKLVFRVKARIDPTVLRQHAAQIKSGLPGVAYVRLDSSVPWPAILPAETQP